MTVEHVLMQCQKWSELRKECFDRAFKAGATLTLEGLLNTRKGYLAVAKIVQKIELLAQFYSSNLENAKKDVDERKDEEKVGGSAGEEVKDS